MAFYYVIRIMAILSFTFGVATLNVCGFTVYGNLVDSEIVADADWVQASSPSKIPLCNEQLNHTLGFGNLQAVFTGLRFTIIACSIIIAITTLFQVMSAILMIATAANKTHYVAEYWFQINSVVIISTFVALVAPIMYQLELARYHGAKLNPEGYACRNDFSNSNPSSSDVYRILHIKYLYNFYFGVGSNFVVQCMIYAFSFVLIPQDNGPFIVGHYKIVR